MDLRWILFILTIFGGRQLQFIVAQQQEKWKVTFQVEKVVVHLGDVNTTQLQLDHIPVHLNSNFKFVVLTENTKIAKVQKEILPKDIVNGQWKGHVNITAEFLGETRLYVELQRYEVTDRSDEQLPVIVVRKVRVIDHVFSGSVALLVSLLYINFGAALDLDSLKDILRKPVGPAIGFFGQFIIMPITSYVLGQLLFSHSPAMQLGLFFTGVSPGGGASNIWTVILHGNINLSITMTTISNFAAFGMMPLWIFTLGKVIFERGNYAVPYTQIATFAFGLIIPLAIGILIQKFLPRVARVLVRMLKPISVVLILFIVIFAIVTNVYLFQLFEWQIIVGGLALPWIGYSISWLVAKCLKQNSADAITIAIETGIQNTGIAIFLLRFTLEPPNGDLTIVLPVAVAIMTPVPMMILFICRKIWGVHAEPKEIMPIVMAHNSIEQN